MCWTLGVVSDLPADRIDRLAREEIAWCVTVRPDDSPHLTPVWFLFRADTWWESSAAPNKKVRNIAVDPRVSLALEDGRAPTVAEGLALIHRDLFPAEVRSGFARKYHGWDITAAGPEAPRVLLEVPVSRWLLAGVAR